MEKKGRYSLRGWPLKDYIDFLISVGSVGGAFLLTLIFTFAAVIKHISIPQEVYSIPIGFGIFFFAYIWDGLAHRSIYKDQIDKQELFVHHFMVFYSGFPLFASFVLAYWWPGLMLSFIIGFLFLKTMYSIYDEIGHHWVRFRAGRSDMIEMSAHWAQFLGNVVYDVGFLYLIYYNHYAVVKALFN